MKKLLAMVLALVMTLSLAVSANAALVKGVDLNTPATRELVSELLFQSIQVPMVTYTAAFGYAAVVPHRAEVLAERGVGFAARGDLRVQPGRGRVGVRLERRVGLAERVVEVLHLDEVLLLPLREGIVVGFFMSIPQLIKLARQIVCLTALGCKAADIVRFAATRRG